MEYDSGTAYVNPGSKFVEVVLLILSWSLVVLTFPFSLILCLKIVQPYETALILRLGSIRPQEIHGVFLVLPCIETFVKVDTRSRVCKVPAQEVLTKDQVTVAIDAVMYYRVSNAHAAITKVANPHESTKLLAQSVLRGALGKIKLHDLLSERDSLNVGMNLLLALITTPWGIKVESIEITDICLPPELRRVMAAAGEAAREAKATVIMADGELRASTALKNAADMFAQSPCAIQLRYLQNLVAISIENNNTIVFPFPTRWSGLSSEKLSKKPKPTPVLPLTATTKAFIKRRQRSQLGLRRRVTL